MARAPAGLCAFGLSSSCFAYRSDLYTPAQAPAVLRGTLSRSNDYAYCIYPDRVMACHRLLAHGHQTGKPALLQDGGSRCGLHGRAGSAMAPSVAPAGGRCCSFIPACCRR